VPIVLLIRHAQASFGTADYDVLSELGHAQVEALHRAVMRRGIVADRVVTGSLRRQRDTGHPWSQGSDGTASVDERWNELDNDDVLAHHSAMRMRLERRPSDTGPALSSRDFQVVFDQALEAWVDAGAESPARQSWPDFLAEVNGALDDLGAGLRSGQTGIAFSSSGVIAALAASLLGLPDRAFVPLNRVSVNTSITKVIVGSRGKTLVSYNDHGHLEGAGIDDLVTYR
jgi:broad specificity phosphatase PhoE